MVERTITDDDGRVNIIHHCNACRNDVVVFASTAIEVRAFKRRRQTVKLRLEAAARDLLRGGDLQ